MKPALPVLNTQWSETDIYTPVQETLTGDERHEFGHWTVGTIDIGTDPSEPTRECGLGNRENPSEPTTFFNLGVFIKE